MKKRRGKLARGVLLLQNDAPAHASQVDIAAVTNCNIHVLLHLLDSPDLAPSDFCMYLFPNLTANLRSMNFGSNEDVIDVIDEFLGNQEERIYFEGISKLEEHWRSALRQHEFEK